MKNFRSMKCYMFLLVLELLPVKASSFNTQSLQFATMNELKKVYARRFATFYFLLGSSIHCLLSIEIRSYFTQHDVCRKTGQIYLSIAEECFSVEVTHNLRIASKNDASPKSFSVDFIHFKSCF